MATDLAEYIKVISKCPPKEISSGNTQDYKDIVSQRIKIKTQKRQRMS